MEAHHPQLFKGIITRVCFGVNCVDWLYTRITIDGEQLDMAHSEVANFIRCLDMKAGTLSREFVWHTKSGKSLKVSFLRFLSMVRTNVGAQRITFEPLNFSGTVQVRSGLEIYQRIKLKYIPNIRLVIPEAPIKFKPTEDNHWVTKINKHFFSDTAQNIIEMLQSKNMWIEEESIVLYIKELDKIT